MFLWSFEVFSQNKTIFGCYITLVEAKVWVEAFSRSPFVPFYQIMISLSSLPFELLTQVFFHVDQTTLTGTCVLVSKLWKSTIEDIGNSQ
jgi:hypothetical protein